LNQFTLLKKDLLILRIENSKSFFIYSDFYHIETS
ncbi:hypothetical protein NT05LI_1302, partial [Listeria ivanovii FSL F6-596]